MACLEARPATRGAPLPGRGLRRAHDPPSHREPELTRIVPPHTAPRKPARADRVREEVARLAGVLGRLVGARDPVVHVDVVVDRLEAVGEEAGEARVVKELRGRARARVARVAQALDEVVVRGLLRHLGRDHVEQCEPPARPQRTRHLLDRAARVAHVVEREAREREVERCRLERQRKCVADLEARVRDPGGARDVGRLCDHRRREVDADSRTRGANAFARSPGPQPTSSARSSPRGATVAT